MERWIFCLVLVFCLLIPNISLSDDWLDFQEFNNGFYFLDDQPFGTLSCTVDLPDLRDLLDKSRKELQAAGINLLIKENLSDFRMYFMQNGKLTFQKPDIAFEYTGTQAPDRARLESGIRSIENGFNNTIDGTVLTLDGVFSSYVRPQRSTYILEMFKRDGGKVYMRYKHEGLSMDVTCSEMECTETASTRAGKMENRENYITGGGKKIIQTIHGSVKQPEQTIVSDLSITYQVVEGLRIPFVIQSSSKMTHATGTYEGKFSILLKGCKVE